MHSFGLPEYGQLGESSCHTSHCSGHQAHCFISLNFPGHNTDGKYFVTSTKMGFHCEMAPKRIVFFIERTKDGKIKPVDVDEIRDFSCGTNHTVKMNKLISNCFIHALCSY